MAWLHRQHVEWSFKSLTTICYDLLGLTPHAHLCAIDLLMADKHSASGTAQMSPLASRSIYEDFVNMNVVKRQDAMTRDLEE